jgi:hypothetical protein
MTAVEPTTAVTRASGKSYWQRFNDMLHVCGPQSWPHLLSSARDLGEAADLLRRASEAPGSVDGSAVERARRLQDATLHPDTGKPIHLPFRMAAHVPVNTMLLIGMLTAASPPAVGAWQFLNQSFNAAQFYANRNASNEVADSTLAASYLGAVASAVGVGVGLSRWADAAAARAAAAGVSAALPRHIRTLTPFLAAAAAKPLQIGLMRQDEWRHGVEVSDADGRVRGRSVAAGRWAIITTIATRTIYLAPMLYLPYLHAAMVRALRLEAGAAAGASAGGEMAGAAGRGVGRIVGAPRGVASMALLVALTALSSAYVTPACMAIFDRQSSLPVRELEPEFHGLAGSRALGDGPQAAVERLYFNKGL